MKEEVSAPDDPWRPEVVRGEIAIQNVCFEYTPDQLVLRDVDLIVRAGERIAVLARSVKARPHC